MDVSPLETTLRTILTRGIGPGHFLEVQKLLPLLTKAPSDDQPSFHVVALSLPNFGFSEAPKKTGFSASQYAEVCNKLMLALGYDEYGTPCRLWPSYRYETHRCLKLSRVEIGAIS